MTEIQKLFLHNKYEQVLRYNNWKKKIEIQTCIKTWFIEKYE